MKFDRRLFLMSASALAILPAEAFAQNLVKLQELVDKAMFTIQTFSADPNMGGFRNNVPRAKAIMIVPTMVKAGFIFGGSGGNGVLLARGGRRAGWSYPAFYKMGSVTFGLQIGGEVAEVVLMIMTQRGLDAMLSTDVKLGADVSIAVGPLGAGTKAQTVDILAFSRAKGLYGGINVEGAIVGIENSWNTAYYRKPVRPLQILVERRVRNKAADRLRRAVARAATGRMPR